MSSPRELVKLYYRIGEVAQIVGVQPHVLRYWETEFRTIKPQKSGKGQRVYSRRDVEKLLKVKDLLKNQGFTIAGARRKLREAVLEVEPEANVESARPAAREETRFAPVEAPAPFASSPVAAVAQKPQARVREALLALREEIVQMIDELDLPPPPRPRLPSVP